ncbi:uncharacterized protein LOC129252959 [Anastrepha obliqua]|uniref:uncharacterized protein LOC129250108 n=1 Tax=Anastrepha obliqua TaxID=95512 RepID=UPI002409D219|nr:uncharacterized protein LOC129250108 [Anastrepha obliqua]XP_054746346.1 uncharacterized protein LOC129250774 [Anastrepha obliqua]XP_054747137.1 uncharacterized protein LOC129252959 [Anastrepha obliqua]
MNTQQNEKNKKYVPRCDTIPSSEEDTLLASSQDTAESAKSKGSTSHSTPLPIKQQQQQTILPQASKKAADGTQRESQVAKKHKSEGALMKSRYTKARFILSKIAKNELAGATDERDAADKLKYQQVVKEYEDFLSKKPKEDDRKKGDALKRNRSQDVIDQAPKRPKVSSSIEEAKQRPFSEVVKDNLLYALIDETTNSGKVVLQKWGQVEAKLSKLVLDKHVVGAQGGTLPSFDSAGVLRGCRVIKCDDDWSRVVLERCVAEISSTLEGLKLKLIPAKDIPCPPRARIWLPVMDLSGAEVLKYLKSHNPAVPMDDWAIVKAEKPQKSSMSFVLQINDECLPILKQQDNKMRFGLRKAKLKIFKADSNENEEDPDEVDNNIQLERLEKLDLAEDDNKSDA